MPPLHVFLRGQKGTKPRKPSPNTMKQHTPHHLPRLSCWLRNQCLQSARLYSKYIKIWIQQITMWSTYIIIIHHNSSYIYMTSCSSKHMQHIAAWCMTSPNFFFCSAWCMTRKVVETCQNDSSFAPVTPVDSMPSLQAVKHNAINLRLLCLAKVGNTQWQ